MSSAGAGFVEQHRVYRCGGGRSEIATSHLLLLAMTVEPRAAAPNQGEETESPQPVHAGPLQWARRQIPLTIL